MDCEGHGDLKEGGEEFLAFSVSSKYGNILCFFLG